VLKPRTPTPAILYGPIRALPTVPHDFRAHIATGKCLAIAILITDHSPATGRGRSEQVGQAAPERPAA